MSWDLLYGIEDYLEVMHPILPFTQNRTIRVYLNLDPKRVKVEFEGNVFFEPIPMLSLMRKSEK